MDARLAELYPWLWLHLGVTGGLSIGLLVALWRLHRLRAAVQQLTLRLRLQAVRRPTPSTLDAWRNVWHRDIR